VNKAIDDDGESNDGDGDGDGNDDVENKIKTEMTNEAKIKN
jgi:hypothetical protein